MSAPRPRKFARRLIVGGAIALLLPLLPVPKLEFVPVASATTVQLQNFSLVQPDDVEAMAESAGIELDGPRVVGGSTEVDDFSMIGVRFDEVPDGPVLSRVLESDGSWTDWQELEIDADSAPDRGTKEFAEAAATVVTEPVWVGSAEGFELSLAPGDAQRAEVSLVREEQRRVVTESVPFAEASMGAPFGIHSRAAWGARPPKSTPSLAPRLDLAVVHHTASTNNYTAAQVPSILRGMQAYHMDTNGWSDIGYNLLVDRFGRTWEGRGGGVTNPVVGAHAQGFNTRSVGVAIIGNFVGASTTAASVEAVSRAVGWKLSIYGAAPTGTVNFTSGGSSTIPAGRVVTLPRVVGHRDVGSTACPGSVHGSLRAVRTRANEYYRTYAALRNPVGSLDSVVLRDDQRVELRGWAKDPDTSAPVVIHAVVGGRWHITTADRSRPDVGAKYPGYGSNRGFTIVSGELPPGAHQVCAYAINQGVGTENPLLGCRGIVVK